MGQGLCCSQVSESTVGIEERWGRFVEVLHPGCHCVCCCFGSRVVGALTMRVQQMDVHCESKTKDNVFVMVVASIQYRVAEEHAKEAFYKLSRPQEQIQAYVLDVVRSRVSQMNLDHVFEQKTEIAKSVEDELEKAMKTYGYKIVQTLIINIIPDQAVTRAMNEINAAARIRVAAQDKAEADKILQVKCAEAEAQSKYLSGQGIARQRQAIMDGLRESVLGFSHDVPGTTPKDVMDMVILSQYFDTMRDIGTHVKSSAVFIPHQICSSLLQDDTFTDAACKSKEAAGPRPLRVIDVKATIKNREWGGIYFKRRWGSWHVISHTWSAGIRQFSETVGIRVGTAGGGSSSSSCSYEELFETADFSKEKCYQELIEFLEILRIDGVSWVWFDALCINQTDDKEKEAEIQHMGAFYQESLGCYVAHHGIGMGFKVLDDFSGAGAADAVLSGYIMRNWDAYLPRWFSRVWTLQEWALPKQMTFIVEGLDMERLTMPSDENRIHPELPCLDSIELRPIRGQQGRYFATDKAYLSLVELYRSFTKIAVTERIQQYKRMMLKFPHHFNTTAKPEIDAGMDVSLVVKEISQRHASHEEDRVLSILKLLGVEAAFQVRTKRSLKEQVIHLAESLVLKQQQEVLLQLCLVDGDGNEWQGMSWAPTFNVLQGEISVQGLQRHIIRSWFDTVFDNNWVIQNFQSAGARVVEVSDGGCLKLESKVLQGELNISHIQRWGTVGAELTVAGKPLLPLSDLDVPHTAERAPHVFGVLAKVSASEAQGGVVWKGPGLYQKMCKLSPKIRVWLVRMGSAMLMRPAMRRTWRHFTYFLVCIDAMPTSLITDGGGTLLLHKAGYFALPTGRVISIVHGTAPSTIILGGFGADLSPYIMPSNSGSP